MVAITNMLINYWCVLSLGFFLGGLLVFILSCLHHAGVYDEMCRLKSELNKIDSACDE